MFWLGYSGMPRRIMDYPSIFGGWNSIISAGHLITIISFLLFFLILIISLFDNRVSISKTKGVSRLNNRLSFYFYERRKLMYYNKKQIHLLKLGKKQLNIKKNKKNNKDYLEVDLYYYKIIKC